MAIGSAGLLAAYLLGFVMFYPSSFGLPEFVRKISPIFFLPQMFGFYILIPLAIVQFSLAFINHGKLGVNFVHYIYSGIAVLVCQALYLLLVSNGLIITN